MDSVRKIVNCTPEQYMTLLKEGQVEVNGEVKTKEDGTLYNPGELPLLEWYNKIMAAQYAEYEVVHTPVVTKTLEQEYEDIVAAYPKYKTCSAIGYSAVLHKNDLIGVTSKYNCGEFYLNGERVTSNYAYRGDGCEHINVWVFETIYNPDFFTLPPVLGDSPSYVPYEVSIKNIGQSPEVSQSYYLYADKITVYNFSLPYSAKGCRVLVAKGTTNFNQALPITVQEVYSDCEKLTKNIGAKNHTKKVSLPECTEIAGDAILRDLIVTNWEFGKLKKIQTTGSTAMFYSSHTVYIPGTVEYIIGRLCTGNTNIRLECNEAKSISDDWCIGAPANFTMAKDWYASVNIAVAAKSWTKDRFLDLFENYLVDLTPVGDDGLIFTQSEITIPQTIYDVLTDEEFALAEDKGWIVGGA